MEIKIGNAKVGINHPTYFVADIAANHDGNLERALGLIRLAAESGANAAKFQNFTATEIVSDAGFRELGQQIGHQAKWDKPVSEVYAEASIPHSWTPELKAMCDKVGIDYFSAAYDFKAVDMLDPYVPAFKIGSGDLNWLEMLEYTSKKGKPMLLATGASTMQEVRSSVETILSLNNELVLMQCNTNYTGSSDNFAFQNINVIKTYAEVFPDLVLGLSDHTAGHSTVLGAVTLGARVIEKHFTDDVSRSGPDHAFSLDPDSWREMVDRTRELEIALGNGIKVVEANEKETVVIQRRALRASKQIFAGEIIDRSSVSVLRPAPSHSILANSIGDVIGKVAVRDIEVDTLLTWESFE